MKNLENRTRRAEISLQKLLWLAAMMIPAFLLTSNVSAQSVGGAAIKAKFGVEADAQANQFQPNQTLGPGTDDWFKNNNTTGDGLGVIDVTGAAALKTSIQGNNNFIFEKRMSATGVNNGTLWLDAVYGRDYNTAQNNKDATVFTSTSDKNFHNTATWNVGTGSAQQKNDLIDVFAHLRRDGATDDFDLWAFFGATTRSSDGNAYLDFELFRRVLGFTGSRITNGGPDFGHTSWKFDLNNADPAKRGEITQSGDVLLSFDFTNGGTVATADIRVWIRLADIGGSFAAFNALEGRPFDFQGTFDHENGVEYGYARILPKGGGAATSVFAKVNTFGATLAGPWGTLEGPKAQYRDNYAQFQLAEFGINLSAFGLDPTRVEANGVCSDIFGSLMVKSRASASFTSELADFAGPFEFGNTVEVDKPEVILTEASICGSPTGSLEVSNPVAGAHYTLKQIGAGGNDEDLILYDAEYTSGELKINGLKPGFGFELTVSLSGCDATITCEDTDNITIACPPSCTGTTAMQTQSSSSLAGAGDVQDKVQQQDKDITAYPVPFSERATVEFRMANSERYEINLYDMKGTLIKQLKSGKAKAGELQQIEIDGQKLPEGMYLVRVVTRDGAQTVKLLKKE